MSAPNVTNEPRPSPIEVGRETEQRGRWHWTGTIHYRGAPTTDETPDLALPPYTLDLGPYYARTLDKLTRKLDEAEGALHRQYREALTETTS